jgi:hypothetical protein
MNQPWAYSPASGSPLPQRQCIFFHGNPK